MSANDQPVGAAADSQRVSMERASMPVVGARSVLCALATGSDHTRALDGQLAMPKQK